MSTSVGYNLVSEREASFVTTRWSFDVTGDPTSRLVASAIPGTYPGVSADGTDTVTHLYFVADRISVTASGPTAKDIKFLDVNVIGLIPDDHPWAMPGEELIRRFTTADKGSAEPLFENAPSFVLDILRDALDLDILALPDTTGNREALLNTLRTTLANKTSQALFDVPYDQSTFAANGDAITGHVVVTHESDTTAVSKRLSEWFGLVEVTGRRSTFVIAEHHKPQGWSGFSDMPTTFDITVEEDH